MTILEERAHQALARISSLIYEPLQPLEVAAWHVHGEPVPAEYAFQQQYHPFLVGEWWGGLWDTTWFRFRTRIPEDWHGKEVVALVRLTEFEYEGFTAEGLIYKGSALQRAINANRREVEIAASARSGDPAASTGTASLRVRPIRSITESHGTNWHRQTSPV